MLKAAPPQCVTKESFIYISCCRKYIRMTNGLRPLAELCMDGCFADKVAVRLAIKRARSIVVADADCYPSANGPPEQNLLPQNQKQHLTFKMYKANFCKSICFRKSFGRVQTGHLWPRLKAIN